MLILTCFLSTLIKIYSVVSQKPKMRKVNEGLMDDAQGVITDRQIPNIAPVEEV